MLLLILLFGSIATRNRATRKSSRLVSWAMMWSKDSTVSASRLWRALEGGGVSVSVLTQCYLFCCLVVELLVIERL